MNFEPKDEADSGGFKGMALLSFLVSSHTQHGSALQQVLVRTRHTGWYVASSEDTLARNCTPDIRHVLTFVFSGPAPSIGTPRPSSTRPRVSGPTGTSTMAPVRFTVPPSRISLFWRQRRTGGGDACLQSEGVRTSHRKKMGEQMMPNARRTGCQHCTRSTVCNR